jgi:ferredoxin
VSRTEGNEKRITFIVQRAVKESTENYLHAIGDREFGLEPAWGAPLLGFAAADDPLFEFLKQDIGEFYLTPAEIFALTFGGEAAAKAATWDVRPGSAAGQSTLGALGGVGSGGGLSVVSWVLPQTDATKQDQRREGRVPADRWISSRAFWPELSRDIHDTVVRELNAIGLRAVAPEMSAHYSTETSPRYGRASRWSQRHTAFIAGLGTFGLSDGLITPVGKAMRAGSVVVEARLEPTPRRYDSHRAWCAFFADGSCADCVDRCPAGAITVDGHDKDRCETYIRNAVAAHTTPLVGERTAGCGLCQSGVRCESAIPPSIGV